MNQYLQTIMSITSCHRPLWSVTNILLIVSLIECAHSTSLFLRIDKHTAQPRHFKYFDFRINPQVTNDIYIRNKRNVDETTNIKSLVIESRLASQFGETTMEGYIENLYDENKDASIDIQIPETAFISNFTMIINGETYVADVKSKEEAERLFNEAREENKTAGQVSSRPPEPQEVQRGMELFTVRVTVQAQSGIHFMLTYLQALVRTLGKFEQRISIRPGQVVDNLTASVYIYEEQGFSSLDVFEPSLNTNSLGNEFTTVTHVSDYVKEITYIPSLEAQNTFSSEPGIAGDLIIRYDVNHGYDIGNIQVQGDYFVHHFSPDENQLEVQSKQIVFVIDISGSMGGRKIEQTREAMLAILSWLHPDDRFMLILFDDSLEFWPSTEELRVATTGNVNEAKYFVEEKVVASGSTNINSALVEAATYLAELESLGGNIIVFLTDGQPTAGVTNSNSIIGNVVTAVRERSSIYSLGFGFSLDFLLLEKLAYRTHGYAVRIYEDQDATSQLTNFFLKINNPLLFNLEFAYTPSVIIANNGITTTYFSNFFKGSELTVAGTLSRGAGITDMMVTCIATGSEQDDFEMTTNIDTTNIIVIPPEASDIYVDGFIEKLYAYMKIKDLLREELVTDDTNLKDQLTQQALDLALEYKFVTPLTSMIIVQRDESVDEREFTDVMGGMPTSNHGVVFNSRSDKVKEYRLCTLISAVFVIILMYIF